MSRAKTAASPGANVGAVLPRRFLLALVALVALGCGARSGYRSARAPDGRAMARLQRQAQHDMQCREPIHVLALDRSAYQVDGCGQMREYAYVCPGRRCAFEPIVPAVMRASADLQCAPDQLSVAADRPTHRAFYGCSRGAAYALFCLDHGCTWSRTGEAVAPAGAPASTPFATLSTAPTAAPAPTPPPAGDPTLADVAIPPPPGAPSAFAPTPVPPPPAAAPAPAPAPGPSAPASSDAVVVPPPPS